MGPYIIQSNYFFQFRPYAWGHYLAGKILHKNCLITLILQRYFIKYLADFIHRVSKISLILTRSINKMNQIYRHMFIICAIVIQNGDIIILIILNYIERVFFLFLYISLKQYHVIDS